MYCIDYNTTTTTIVLTYCYCLICTQALLVLSSGAYLLASIFQTSGFALLCSVVVQFCVGVYWPCIGYFRGRLLLPEQRNTVMVLSRCVHCCHYSADVDADTTTTTTTVL